MTASTRALEQILADRTSTVVEVARLNSARLRYSQLAGGIEIELLVCRRQLAASAGSDDAQRALDETLAREAHIRTELERCDEQICALDHRLAELDRELARA